jgi:hypothetical protein
MLGGLGVLASRLLGLGNLRLAGIAPSGQWYLASPRRLWVVRDGGAELGGEDFGPARPLPRQPRLGQFWVPQHSVLAIGAARFERFDADRHRVPA